MAADFNQRLLTSGGRQPLRNVLLPELPFAAGGTIFYAASSASRRFINSKWG